MNYKLYSTLAFVAGAAIGSIVTWKCVKTKYEQIAQEEIDSVKEVFARKQVESLGEEMGKGIGDGVKTVTQPKPDLMEYASRIKDLGYSDNEEDSDSEEKYYEEKEEDEMMSDGPYVISPDEFDENGYETESLTYYADGIVTDSYGEVIDDVDDVIGLESLEHFGEYEDDSVFVRNDDRECDYEILKDYRNYYDVFPPKNMED